MKKYCSTVSLSLGALLLCLFAAGCRSAFISATITNHSGEPLSLIEVDYPSASFGLGSLAPDGQFHYRFKIQGSGPIKMQFTDAAGKAHNVSGPDMAEGDDGTLEVTIGSSKDVSWIPNLTRIR
jgi:hypothetical protein